jgi:hypothetical protein
MALSSSHVIFGLGEGLNKNINKFGGIPPSHPSPFHGKLFRKFQIF